MIFSSEDSGKKIRAKDNFMYFVAIERQLTRTAYNNK